MKVFYSWQSDTPGNIGKSFIQIALQEAIDSISTELSIEAAERLHLDQDTKGVLGSPSIVETILDKIKNSIVFVGDVTLVGQTESSKPLINSNVAIELGFALGSKGDSILLCVMNTHFGTPDNLPFDLRNRRHPVKYSVSPDASNSVRRTERAKLTENLIPILRDYIQDVSRPEETGFISSTLNDASYWQENEFLVNEKPVEDWQSHDQYAYRKDLPMVYLRVRPTNKLQKIPNNEITRWQTNFQPIMARGSRVHRNKYGFIKYWANDELGNNNKNYSLQQGLRSSVQLFNNRELWAVDIDMLSRRSEADFGVLPTLAVRDYLLKALLQYIKFAVEELDYASDIKIEIGMVNISGFKLGLPGGYVSQYEGEFFKDVSSSKLLTNSGQESIGDALNEILEGFFAEAGSNYKFES